MLRDVGLAANSIVGLEFGSSVWVQTTQPKLCVCVLSFDPMEPLGPGDS